MDPAFDPSSFAILVVDDEETQRTAVAELLVEQGYVAFLAASGAEAIERLGSAGCDLVVLDVGMPGVSGLDVLRELRKRHRPEDLPVIMVSSRPDSAIVAQCLRSGANDYVTKPLDPVALLARVQAQLSLKVTVEALRASEQRFRLLAELSADMISLHSPDGTFRFASPACRELLGVEPADLEGKALYDLLHPTDRAAMPPRLADLPEFCTLVVRLRRSDRSWVWCEVKSRTLRGSRTGRVTDVQLSTRDVSFYVDAWTGLPLPNAPQRPGREPQLPASHSVPSPTHPDVASSVVVHQEHLVKASVEPPPVRKRRPTNSVDE
jgi:PAS domain S-box-containing protein